MILTAICLAPFLLLGTFSFIFLTDGEDEDKEYALKKSLGAKYSTKHYPEDFT